MATIVGKVFLDVNNNGTFDTGDSGLSGINVTIRNTTSNYCKSVLTNSAGDFTLTVNDNQTYVVYETNKNLVDTYSDAEIVAMNLPQPQPNFISTTARKREVKLTTGTSPTILFGHNVYNPFPTDNTAYLCASPIDQMDKKSALYEISLIKGADVLVPKFNYDT